MSAKVKALRGLIFSKFDSEAEFAQSIGWPRQRLSKISNGKKQPTLHEIDAMSKGLNIQPDQLMGIFLTQKSPNGQL